MSELIKALVAARKAIGAAKKGAVNPHFRSKYADLGSVMEAVKEPLEAHGLAFVQDIKDGQVWTVILHEAGERLDLAPFPIVASKQDAQGHGSALTYARRYSLQTALGVPAEDDDGNAAVKAPVISPVKEVMKDIPAEYSVKAAPIASSLIDLHNASQQGDSTAEYSALELVEPMETDMRLAVWNELQAHSRVRAWLKKVMADNKKAA